MPHLVLPSRRRRALLAALCLLPLLPLPALATGAPDAAAVLPVHTTSALQPALQALVAHPGAATGRTLTRALTRALVRSASGRSELALTAAAPTASPDGLGEPEPVWLASAGDVDGDRRADVLEQRETGTVLRSGRDGGVRLRRPAEVLVPVSGAGAVRLLALRFTDSASGAGYTTTLRLQGLDRTGRARWTQTLTGSVTSVGTDLGGAALLDGLLGQLAFTDDAAGRPALLLGRLSGTFAAVGAATSLAVSSLALADGSSTDLVTVAGAGQGLPYAAPLEGLPGRRGCFTTAAPLAAASTVALQCGTAAPVWTRPVDLVDAFPVLAGDFDGDRVPDLAVSTFGFEPPGPADVTRGTRVLSGADGTQRASSTLDGLVPLGVDVSGDRQPDFLQPLFDRGLGVAGVTLAGKVLYRREVELRSGSLSLSLGTDVTGDGAPDGLLVAEPSGSRTSVVVVEGRRGRALVVPGGRGLLLPGLRGRGGDVLVQQARGGRLALAVRAGDDGRALASVVVPGSPGVVSPGSATLADVDGDRRPDLVVASRTDDTRRTTALRTAGSTVWQRSERAPARRPAPEGLVLD